MKGNLPPTQAARLQITDDAVLRHSSRPRRLLGRYMRVSSWTTQWNLFYFPPRLVWLFSRLNATSAWHGVSKLPHRFKTVKNTEQTAPLIHCMRYSLPFAWNM